MDGLYKGHFAEAFSKLLDKTGVSCYHINQYTHLDQAYLSRLRSGKKDHPNPEVIIKIALAICHYGGKTRLSDIESLFRSTGRTLKYVAAEF